MAVIIAQNRDKFNAIGSQRATEILKQAMPAGRQVQDDRTGILNQVQDDELI